MALIDLDEGVVLDALDRAASGVRSQPAVVMLDAPALDISPVADVAEAAADDLDTLALEEVGSDGGAFGVDLSAYTARPGSRLLDARDLLDGYDQPSDNTTATSTTADPTLRATGAVGGALAGLARDSERAASDTAVNPAEMKDFAGFSLASRMGVKLTAPEEADAFSFTGLTTEAAQGDAPLDPFKDAIDPAWADELARAFELDGLGSPLNGEESLAATPDLSDLSLQAPMPDGWVV